jgi:hypothetical protein
MSAVPIPIEPVELRYALTPDDCLDAIVAQRRGIRRPWIVPVLTTAVVGALGYGVVVTGGLRNLPPGATAILAGTVSALALIAVVGFSLLARFLLASRWIYRWHVRLLTRGNPWLLQPVQAAVTDTGLHVANATGSSTVRWHQYPLYVETDRSFVLLTSAGLGATVLVLPKRGLVAADPARLRALLETHSQRRT